MKIGNFLLELGKGILAFASGFPGALGCYPLLPAYFGCCSTGRNPSGFVVIGAVTGVLMGVPAENKMKYLFILLIISLATRFYRALNKDCGIWETGFVAGVATLVMNLAENTFCMSDTVMVLKAGSEGVLVAGLTVGFYSLMGIPYGYLYDGRGRDYYPGPSCQKLQTEKMESLAYAVGGLSDAFMAMSRPKEKFITDEVGSLEQELTCKLCGSCDVCALCWNENRMSRQGGIRALLFAVVNHGSKEELLDSAYVEGCNRYETMVEEALRAFSRLELNHAWYNRLQENRLVIAKQLDAMACLMEEWAKSRRNVDEKFSKQLGRIVYEAREKSLLVEDLHIYEDGGRLCVEGMVSGKWDGGIPVKSYVRGVERVLHRTMRTGKDTKSILTAEGTFVALYEDTRFYGLQGIASRMKNGSTANGDSYSFFAMDDGSYHVCLSDGMGSGLRAKQESEMVVDLLQKFIEAGFKKETAISLMNSAMVLQGEDNIYSTLDYAMIQMYTGEVEIVKIGGAATFIKRGESVECIDEGSLPAGADIHMEVNSRKIQLENGDFLVMVTDGVIEYLHVSNPKETLSEMIGSLKTENAGALAEMLIEQVMQRTGGYAMDDMTVLVTGIWEKP